MARGWESKSVEAQQDEAASRRPARPALSGADAARQAQAETIKLALTEKRSQLQLACSPAHRASIEAAIAQLEANLSRLKPGS